MLVILMVFVELCISSA